MLAASTRYTQVALVDAFSPGLPGQPLSQEGARLMTRQSSSATAARYRRACCAGAHLQRALDLPGIWHEAENNAGAIGALERHACAVGRDGKIVDLHKRHTLRQLVYRDNTAGVGGGQRSPCRR